MNNNEIEKKYMYMFADYPDIVSVAQVKKMLGISRTLAYELVNQKKIKAFQLGNSFKIPKVNVISYIISNQEDLERNFEKRDVKNSTERTENDKA